MTESVKELLKESGFPGMKVLELAFDSRDDNSSEYLPHNFIPHCVAYAGTHDNDTILGWIDEFDSKDIEFAKKYLNLTEEEGYTWGMIRGAFTSVSRIAILQMQDLLLLDNSARMNIPGTLGDNWTWRMEEKNLNEDVILKLKDLTEMSGRL